MRAMFFFFAILHFGCGSERNIEYGLSGSGSKGLTISYRNADNKMVSVTEPSLPWSKWVAFETGDTAELVATCSYSSSTGEVEDACCLGSASIKNPDNITLESDRLWGVGCADKVEATYKIDY